MSKIYQKTHPAGKKAGFTLIELLVVVLIVGILAAVVLPQYQVAVMKSRLATTMSGVKAIAEAAEVYYMANGVYPPDNITLLDISNLSGCSSLGDGKLSCNNGNVIYDLNSGTDQWAQNEYVQGRVLENGEVVVRYNQYLNYSPNHAGERFCQATVGSELAHKVCKSLGGTPLPEDSTSYRLP